MIETASRSRTATLTLAALGVVYGDIGTSPLYTMHEVFAGPHNAVPLTHAHVLGVLSVIFWSLTMVVACKYAMVIMRADNKGEGGIMALTSLVLHHAKGRIEVKILTMLGLFGAALFCGDVLITPAISVLSAVEGLTVSAPKLSDLVIPISLGVLFALFAVQKHGTGKVGVLFGPVTLVWFLVLAALGIVHIAANPAVLAALDPRYFLAYAVEDPKLAFLSLAATVLAVTGAETLYADMGHFGRKPIRLGWFGLVFPALIINYFGQGALLLSKPEALENPFFHMAPSWAQIPLVAIATAATVIASQAVISGAYSIARQSMQLGFLPRMAVQHTSQHEIGQIFVPAVNWSVFVAVALLVVGFGSSTKLAAAYGIAVTGTMVITTLLVLFVMRRAQNWSLGAIIGIGASFLVVDTIYFSANLSKLMLGGWFPLVIAGAVFTFMTTWKRGRKLLAARMTPDEIPLSEFAARMATSKHTLTVPGTAVYMTPRADRVPHALLHTLKHFKSLHERVVILSVCIADIPHVVPENQIVQEQVDERFCMVRVTLGFMDEPDMPETLARLTVGGRKFRMMEASIFLGRETLIPKLGSEMAFWREKLFAAMYRNSGSAVGYFNLPPDRIVEVGSQVVM